MVVLYNPSSHKRADYLQRLVIFFFLPTGSTLPAGYAKQGREGQEHRVLTLGEMAQEETDMVTTVIIGNSSSRIIKGRIAAPGYRELP